jgi:hypothetical protein
MPDPDAALVEVRRLIATAAAAHQLRAEMTGHHCIMSQLICFGEPEGVKAHFDRAEEIVRQLGSRRFHSMNLAMMAEAHRQLGDRKLASAMLDEALLLARETAAMNYFGGSILGFRALTAYDDPELRLASLREGELAVARGGFYFNTMYFFAYGIESCIVAEDWGKVRHLADLFAASFPIEQPPGMEFLAERCLLLAEAAERGIDRSLRRRMEQCRDRGRAVGYTLFLRQLDRYLD